MAISATVAAATAEASAACARSSEFHRLVSIIDEIVDSRRSDRRVARLSLRQVRELWCDGCPIFDACREFARAEPRFCGVAAGQYWRDGHPFTSDVKRAVPR